MKKQFFVFVILAFLITSCGLDDYVYIYPVNQGNIVQHSSDRATVPINSDNGTVHGFSNYIIFYRIYISEDLFLSTISDNFNNINPLLLSNHNSIRPLIGSETFGNRNLEAIFRDLGFYFVEVQGASIDNILGTSVLPPGNQTTFLEFDFGHEGDPNMTIIHPGSGSSSYTLFRSSGGGSFTTRPLGDRTFNDSTDLKNREYINNDVNADVADLRRNNVLVHEDDMRYTYAAFYIAAVGIDATTYTSIFSTPSLINVFLLP